MGYKWTKKGITMDLILVLNSYNWNTKINFKIVYTGYKQINSKWQWHKKKLFFQFLTASSFKFTFFFLPFSHFTKMIDSYTILGDPGAVSRF